jgi:signal transduction histidine kinase
MEIEHRYKTLYDITKALNSLAPDVVLHNFVESVSRTINAKGCSLMLFTPDKRQLIHTVSCGLSSDYLEKGPVKSDAIIDEVLKGNPVAILDANLDPRIQYKEQAKKEGIASMLSIPLTPLGEILGIMRVYTSEPRQFSADDIEFLCCLANVGVISLQKARVHEALGKSLEERCKEIADMIEERNRFLRFLGIAAHDLKAPLTAIQSYFGVMLGGFSGELNEKQKFMIERSSLRITELLKLISNLLDIPRIETGQLLQELKECSLLDVINNCLNEMRGLAVQKRLNLKAELPESLSPIQGSAPRLQQVLTNLVNNAICYTPEGEIVVRAIDGDKEIRVEVIDSGIGIPPEDLPHLFTDFFRASNVKSKGTGLGLSISRRIIEAHGGRIWCDSPCPETHAGSRFTFTLPKLYEAERRQP